MKPQHWVILGNDVCSWSAALFLHRHIPATYLNITVVRTRLEPNQQTGLQLTHETVAFHQLLGLDEASFLTETKASIYLATEFNQWTRENQRLTFAATAYGQMQNRVDFFHWLQKFNSRQSQPPAQWQAEHFNLNICAANLVHFAPVPAGAPDIFDSLQQGYQVNEAHYCRYLEGIARARGINIVAADTQLPEAGEQHLMLSLANGEASKLGFDYLLTTQMGAAGPLQWQDCTNTIALGCQTSKALPAQAPTLFIKLHKTGQGWQRRLTTQDEVLITDYCVALTENSAHAGFNSAPWSRQRIHLGSALCQLGDCIGNTLAVTQRALLHLLMLFPYQDSEDKAREFNRLVHHDCNRLLDLHNFMFWRAGLVQQLTPSLQARIELFARLGVCRQSEQEFISDSSWQILLAGLHRWPSANAILTQAVTQPALDKQLAELAHQTHRAASAVPPLVDYLHHLKTLR